MKKRILITFFDSNYIPKAIATYSSLSKYLKNFKLFAFCFDDLATKIIEKLGYKNFIAVSYRNFENVDLLKSKRGKEKLYEYYWSYKPYLIRKIMNETKAELVTYCDCDFMFFSSPEPIFKEAERADVLIQPNNFSFDEEKQFLPVGYYCSCWESFKNNHNGRMVLNWWHKKCMEWCYARFEEGKFADQKYLDDWRIRFKGVREVTQIGANLAPWNIQKYDISKKKRNVLINDQWPLVYYHYHSFKMNLNDFSYIITGDRENFYRITNEVVEIIYKPYIKLLKQVIIDLKKIPEYKKYAKNNPESNIKLRSEKVKTTFNSYKNAVN